MTTGPQAFSLKYMPFLLFSGKEKKKVFFHLLLFFNLSFPVSLWLHDLALVHAESLSSLFCSSLGKGGESRPEDNFS